MLAVGRIHQVDHRRRFSSGGATRFQPRGAFVSSLVDSNCASIGPDWSRDDDLPAERTSLMLAIDTDTLSILVKADQIYRVLM